MLQRLKVFLCLFLAIFSIWVLPTSKAFASISNPAEVYMERPTTKTRVRVGTFRCDVLPDGRVNVKLYVNKPAVTLANKVAPILFVGGTVYVTNTLQTRFAFPAYVNQTATGHLSYNSLRIINEKVPVAIDLIKGHIATGLDGANRIIKLTDFEGEEHIEADCGPYSKDKDPSTVPGTETLGDFKLPPALQWLEPVFDGVKKGNPGLFPGKGGKPGLVPRGVR